MALPESVEIYEVGPREGFQIEDEPVPTERKVAFVDALSEAGFRSIEVTSFVHPRWVPQMADAEEVMARIRRKPGVAYRGLFLNARGLERALAAGSTVDGVLMLTASDTFSRRNTNRGIEETFQALPDWIRAYQAHGLAVDEVDVMAAFGCNFEGHVPLERVLGLIDRAERLLGEHGERLRRIKLADTMGWANPEQMRRTIAAVRERWPGVRLALHLHDTRGLGLANAYAALLEGVREFETAVGGLGGCPSAAVKGAAGNLVTEDFAFLCEEMGVATGLDLERLIELSRLAEEVVGHPLPAHLPRGGLFREVRRGTWAALAGEP